MQARTSIAAVGQSLAPEQEREERLRSLVDVLKRRYAQRISAAWALPASEGVYRAFPPGLDEKIKAALLAQGVERLYAHQAEAFDRVRQKRHLVVATPTASGKSLCYNLPVIDAAFRQNLKALYLFPTKALAQDQVAELSALNQRGGLGLKTFTFDGDTPGDARKAVRTRGDIVLSNPDMLHQAILPHHTKWASFFESLAFVVIDEIHTYRGVFGSHVANLLRRLRRICRFYGVSPQYIMTSATIANPGELGRQLIGEEVSVLSESGAPQGERHLMLWNPPVINAELGIRASARSQTTRIARMAMRGGLKSIIFARSRLMVEVLTKYLKDVFDHDKRKPPRVLAYRGGYLPSERRAAERKMRQGKIACVVSTSALELGVDIGALDVCVLNGYPGAIAATWQRLGRAGRRLRPSLGIMVASSNALDQYIVRNPAFFLEASPESARIAPDQLLILLDHVRCAAFELPFKDGEAFGEENLPELLQYLADEAVLHHEGDRWYWTADGYPANSVSLRSVAEGNFVVVDCTDGAKRVIAEVDYFSAPMTLYPGAIYMIQSDPHQVERLDWEGRKAYVRRVRVDYYTDAIDYNRLSILERFEGVERQGRATAYGEVHLLRRVPGFKKIRYYTHENIGYGNIELPDQQMHTTALWWRLEHSLLDTAFDNRLQALEGFLGAAYALHHVAALRAMSEPSDLGRAVGDSDADWFATLAPGGRGQLRGETGKVLPADTLERFQPTLFLYDNFPGGIGLSAPLYDIADVLVADAAALVAGCDCRYGCPACVGPVLAADEQGVFSIKTAAERILALLHAPA